MKTNKRCVIVVPHKNPFPPTRDYGAAKIFSHPAVAAEVPRYSEYFQLKKVSNSKFSCN